MKHLWRDVFLALVAATVGGLIAGPLGIVIGIVLAAGVWWALRKSDVLPGKKKKKK